MLNIAQFRDWNLDHFLDVAEMTMGMAIGYDWLYDHLSETTADVTLQEKGAILSKDGKQLILQVKGPSSFRSTLGATPNSNQAINALHKRL